MNNKKLIKSWLAAGRPISCRSTGKIDKDGNITDFKLLSYDLVSPPKRTLLSRILNFFKRLWNFIKQR